MNAERRLAAFRRRMVDEEASAALITTPLNARYLTGFEGVFDEGVNAACLITPEISRFYTDARYHEAATKAAEGTTWVVRPPADALYIEICRELRDEGIDSLTIEASVPYARFKFISEQFVGRVHVVEKWVEELRMVKDAAEVEAIERAASIADAAFEAVLATVRPGMREVDVALALESHMRLHGSEGTAFETIVASGPNAARPHAQTTERVIEAGDMLLMDFGARVNGYCSDMTRTVAIGKADEKLKKVYSAVLAASQAALSELRGGLRARDADAVARELLVREGFGKEFLHGLGHGVGLAVHELPTVNSRSDESLPPGCVVTIEPGVYMPDWGGVRIEDLAVAESGGSRVLSHAPKELIEIT